MKFDLPASMHYNNSYIVDDAVLMAPPHFVIQFQKNCNQALDESFHNVQHNYTKLAPYDFESMENRICRAK